MITNDHMGGEGVTQMIIGGRAEVWEGPKYDRAILEQPLTEASIVRGFVCC